MNWKRGTRIYMYKQQNSRLDPCRDWIIRTLALPVLLKIRILILLYYKRRRRVNVGIITEVKKLTKESELCQSLEFKIYKRKRQNIFRPWSYLQKSWPLLWPLNHPLYCQKVLQEKEGNHPNQQFPPFVYCRRVSVMAFWFKMG